MVITRQINAHLLLGMLDLATFSAEHHIEVKREQEKKGTLFLLNDLLKSNDFELLYTTDNKPYLKDRKERISISHSHDKLVVLMNTKEETGVDIELVREKVLSVKHKFLNANEIAIAGNDVERLITYWAAKEALYKVHGRKRVNFRENLFVEERSSALLGTIRMAGFQKKYNLVRELVDEYIMVYVLNEI